MADLDHRSLDWAVEIIGMCEPIRCNQGGMWFGHNHNFADATFVDYGAADAFAVAAKALPALVKGLRDARDAIASLDEYALGGAVVEHTDGSGAAYQYPIRDELVAKINSILEASHAS